jgi:uncharacterized protein YbcI
VNDSTSDSGTEAQAAPPPEVRSERGLMLAAISRAIVGIHKEFLGKGPVRSRAHLSGDMLIVILEGGYLRGEQTLQERGHVEEVVSSRHAMQDALKKEYKQAVETILHRSVRSFMSTADPVEDLQAEIFVLHPEAQAAPDEPAEG